MRWTLRLTPERGWAKSEQLEPDTSLVACVGEAGASLIAVAVRELVANAKRHADADGEAEVRLDIEASTICILIPGSAFDSVTWARTHPGCFLARLNRMLDKDGVL